MAGIVSTGTRTKIGGSIVYLLLLGLVTAIVSPPVENMVRDAMTALISPFTDPKPGIVVVVFDESALSKFPYRSPIDREFLATLIERIDAASPRAIGIDLLFDQPTEPTKDAKLASAIGNARAPVIIASGSSVDGLSETQVEYLEAFAPSAGRGLVALTHDNLDGVVRRSFPGRQLKDDWHPSFAAALGSVMGVESARISEEMIYYRSTSGRPYRFPIYPARAIELAPLSWFEGKYVLIGTDLPQNDRHPTPFTLLAGSQIGTLPGVAIHAHSLARILSGDRILKPSFAASLGIFLACAVLCCWISWQPISIGLKPLAIGAILLLVCTAEVYVFKRYAVLLPIVEPTMLVVGVSALVAFLAWLRDAEQRRWIQTAFSQYVNPEVVTALAKEPSTLKLGGERRIITSVFTDLEGFTEFSEKLEPEHLASILNNYLDEICNAFFEHGATVDKVVGDAVVGFFGAPIAQADQAARALSLTLTIGDVSRAFRSKMAAQGSTLGRTRVGAHSGPAIVGNFGGHHFFDYTAIGDTVNTAARLEGANRLVGTDNCVSREVARQVTGFLLRPVGTLFLKGRNAGIDAFEVLSPSDENVRMCGEYAAAYALLANRKTSKPAFETLHQKYPRDGLIKFHLTRLATIDSGVEIPVTEK